MAKRNYTLEELKSKNLFQLRDIARKLGVENATYLSEEKLMESIIAYEAGEKQPTAEENGISEQTDQAMISRGFIYSEEDFKPFPLQYKVKKESPATKNQIERLYCLLERHRLAIEADEELSCCLRMELDKLSKNEASRYVDRILSKYGR